MNLCLMKQRNRDMSQFTFIEISRCHNLGVIIFCPYTKFKNNESLSFFNCKIPFKTGVSFFGGGGQVIVVDIIDSNNKIQRLRSSNSRQRSCCINFSTVSSLVGSNVPCNKAIRNINVPTLNPRRSHRSTAMRDVYICLFG